MYIPASYPLAVVFCVITMLCWGSWANTQKAAGSSWRFELYYWDYVFGLLITALVLALTLGSTGGAGRSFAADLAQADNANLGSALIGGAVFNLSNILIVAAINIAGMAVAFPVGVGLALVIGVVVNYIDRPEGDPVFLFIGVGLIVAAMVLNALAYRKAKGGGAVSTKGLMLSVLAGSMMGFFYKYVANAMFPDFSQPEPGKLSPYTAVFIFSVGLLLSNFILNPIIMARPFVGEPVNMRQYFAGSGRDHLMGLLGGLIWCLGMSFSIIASDLAGPAISYGLGQGATVVAVLWGIFIWKEFKGAPPVVNTLLTVMMGAYIAGLGLIVFARMA